MAEHDMPQQNGTVEGAESEPTQPEQAQSEQTQPEQESSVSEPKPKAPAEPSTPAMG